MVRKRRKGPARARKVASKPKQTAAPLPVPETPVVEFEEIRTTCSCRAPSGPPESIVLVDPLCPVHSILTRM